MGECPPLVSQALEGASVAPGTLRTLRELTNPEKRPGWTRSPIPPDMDGYETQEQLNLSSEALFKNIRKARRGAAGGPSGMTVEHSRCLLQCDRALDSLHKFAHIMARGEVPDRIEKVVRVGRLRIAEASRGGQRHRRWRCVASPRCMNNRSANCRSGGGSHCSLSICTWTPAPLLSPSTGSALSTLCRETRCCMDC